MKAPRHIAASRTLRSGRIILAALAVAVLLYCFVLDLVIVRGPSMRPTLEEGRLLVVLRCAYGVRLPGARGYLVRWGQPAVGEIVVLSRDASGSREAVKRVLERGPAYLEVDGDTLIASGGGVPLNPDSPLLLSRRAWIAAGAVFVVGDNAAESYDSRSYGAIPIEAVRGKVLCWTPSEGTGR